MPDTTRTRNRPAFATRVIHAGQSPDPSTGAVMQPIYATSTYVQESPGVHKGYEYSRSQNPTRMAYERCIADLESGEQGYAFASGLSAIATLLDCLDSGSHVVAMDDLYGGSYRLFEGVRRRSAGLDFSFVDMADLTKLEASIRPETKLIWVETPTNPLLKLVDLEAVAGLAKKHGILCACDNTFATPWVQRPLELGFDVVMRGSLAAEAKLEIVECPAEAWCLPCAATVPIAQRFDACPRCGSHQLQVTAGDELRIKELEVN